jgi:thioredoxin
MSNAVAVPSITDAAFTAETAHGLVAVDFTAPWCGPCRMMAPIIDDLAQEYAPRVRFLQMDTDDNPATMVRLGVRGLPTILLFNDGQIVDRIVGAVPKPVLRERITRLTAALATG